MRSGAPPTLVAGVKEATQIDAGGLLICARLGGAVPGKVTCWGNEGETVPAGASAPPQRDAIEVSAAEAHACARMSDGTVRCWGDSPWNGVGGPSLARPSVIGAVAITTGDSMACALLNGGAATCWGRNDQGELGRTADNEWHSTPLSVPLQNLTSVVAGEAHVCALLGDATVSCWGSDGDGELGRGKQGPPEPPGPVPGLTDIGELALGADHACALSKSGTIRCWGSNAHGQLGDGTTERRTLPAAVAW
jgi:alpha-tubulin suppressor-like RCC1 family protein